MRSFSVSTRKTVTSAGILEKGFINITEGTVESVTLQPVYDPFNDYETSIAVPGYIDIHTHGYFGVDALESDENNIHSWSKLIAGKGVTSFLPTCVSVPTEDLIKFIKKIETAKFNQGPDEARILGARSEGPYISIERKGAHNPAFVRDINSTELSRVIESSNGILKIMDMAPELNGFSQASALLARAGIIVSAGHSNADFNTATVALASGIKMMTHFYNAMTQFDRRAPGMVGAGLLSSSTFLEIIADFHHVSKEAIKVMALMKGWDWIIAITDSLSIIGMEARKSVLGGLEIEVHDGVAWIAGTNTIAGSVLTLDKAFSNLASMDVKLTDLVKAFSRNPALILGLNDKGDIAPGKVADINFLDKNLNVIGTMIGGFIVENLDA